VESEYSTRGPINLSGEIWGERSRAPKDLVFSKWIPNPSEGRSSDGIYPVPPASDSWTWRRWIETAKRDSKATNTAQLVITTALRGAPPLDQSFPLFVYIETDREEFPLAEAGSQFSGPNSRKALVVPGGRGEYPFSSSFRSSGGWMADKKAHRPTAADTRKLLADLVSWEIFPDSPRRPKRSSAGRFVLAQAST